MGFSITSFDHMEFDSFKFENISKKILEKVKPELEQAVKTSVRQSVKHDGDSELVNSVTTYEPRMTRDGTAASINCTFSGKSSSGNHYNTTDRGRARVKPVLNSDKAFWLEYGRDGQNPAPWKDRALNNAEGKLVPQIQTELEEIMGAE